MLFCNNIINILTMQKAIYVGAGTDILPLLCYPDIKEWIYIDSLPNNEYGPEYVEDFSRPYFINDIINNFNMFGFKIDNLKKDNELIEFTNSKTKQHIKFYLNTYLPDNINKVKYAIQDWDTLIVSGHHPDSCIMNYKRLNYPLTFIGFTGTSYHDQDHDNYNNIVRMIYNNTYYFDTYLFNTSLDWWSLYVNLEESIRDSKLFDSKFDFLPGIFMNLNYRIIDKINNIYKSDNIKNNSIKSYSWKKFINMATTQVV